MKNKLFRALTMMLCLMMVASAALAVDETVLPGDGDDVYRAVRHVAVVGDTVYMLTSSRGQIQLWRWTADMAQAVQIEADLISAEMYYSMEDLRRLKAEAGGADAHDLEHAISVIFTDGEKLYGFNHLNGLVFTLEETERGLHYGDVITLPDTRALNDARADYGSYYSPINVIKAGDWMLWHTVDRMNRSYQDCLLAFNLTTGAVKQAVLPGLKMIAAYKDSKAIVCCEGSNQALYVYDPVTDMAEYLGMLPKDVYVRDVDYSCELDMIIYQDGTRIMGWNAQGEAEQLGFIPTSAYVSAAAVGDTLLFSADDQEVSAATMRKGYSTEHSLNILGGTMNNVLSQFYRKFLDVPFYYMDKPEGESYASMMKREQNIPDLIRVSAAQFMELLTEGCLLDLSVYEELKDYGDVLYPAYKEFVSRDGGIYGIPVSASAYDGWYINKEVMIDMGLKEEDIPTSLTELCKFATRWNNEYAEKYPHYTLLNNTTSYRERFFIEMLEGWSDYCQYSGKELTLDDPIFREMLAALDAAELSKLDEALRQTDPEISEYKQALIWTGCKDVGNWASYMEDFSDRIFLPMKLTPETPYIAAVENMSLWVVNARSDNAEYAAALLAEVVDSLDDVYAYVLRSDKTEPVISEYYPEQLAYAEEVLASLEGRLEDSVNKATIEKRIAEQNTYINTELARMKYTITPSAIENYVKVMMPVSFVVLPDAVNSSDRDPQITGFINRYIGGSLDADEMISRVNELLK